MIPSSGWRPPIAVRVVRRVMRILTAWHTDLYWWAARVERRACALRGHCQACVTEPRRECCVCDHDLRSLATEAPR